MPYGLFNQVPPLRCLYTAVQINVVKGCVSVVIVHATFDHVYWDSRVLISSSATNRCRKIPIQKCIISVACINGAASHSNPNHNAECTLALAL